jgi:hypothetical protein
MTTVIPAALCRTGENQCAAGACRRRARSSWTPCVVVCVSGCLPVGSLKVRVCAPVLGITDREVPPHPRPCLERPAELSALCRGPQQASAGPTRVLRRGPTVPDRAEAVRRTDTWLIGLLRIVGLQGGHIRRACELVLDLR